MDGGLWRRGAFAAVIGLVLVVAGASAASAQTVSTWTGGGSDNNLTRASLPPPGLTR